MSSALKVRFLSVFQFQNSVSYYVLTAYGLDDQTLDVAVTDCVDVWMVKSSSTLRSCTHVV